MQGDLPRIGDELAGYRLESVVSRGGMAVVYLAEDPRLGRRVALKVPSVELATDEVFRARFLREAKIAASIDHPHVVPVYDAGESDGFLYLAMRHVPEADLRELLRKEAPLEIARAISIISQIADALGAAHRRDLVHRDIKPGNVLLVPRSGPGARDHVYLSDFGLAKHTSSGVTGLTETGMFVGTVNYVAPEQVTAKDVDGRADIYALGCVLYECLTGEPPFLRPETIAIVMAHLNDPAPNVLDARPDCPPELAQVIERMLQKDRDDRQRDCDQVIEDLRIAGHAAAERDRSPTVSSPQPVVPVPAPPSTPPPDAPGVAGAGRQPDSAKPKIAIATVALLAVLAAVGLAAGLLLEDDGPETSSPPEGPTPVETVTGGAEWQRLEDAPAPRQQAGGAWVGGKVWLIGGLGGEDAAEATAKVDVFDPVTGTWTAGPSLPEPLHHAVARNYQGTLVVIGGWAPRGTGGLPGVTSGRVYGLDGDSWEQLPDLNHPRAAAAAAVVGGTLYVTGGQADGELVAETEAFDGKRWRDVAPLPTPREHLAAASDGRYIYALGGRALSAEENLSTLERYDPVTDRWDELPEMPLAIGSFDAVIALGHLVAVGGEEPSGVTGQVQAFDLQTEEWSELPALGVPRHGLTVVAGRTVLYALGGAEENAHARSTAAAEVIDLTAAYAEPPAVAEWRPLGSAPEPRQQAAGAVLGGRLWMAGGLLGSEGTEATPSTVAYDPVINGWSTGPDLPVPLHHSAAATLDGELVVIGGWEPEGSNLSAITSGRVFALRGSEWVELPELNHPRAAAGAAVVGERLVVTGGQADGELVAETEVFDGERWTDVAPIPTPREHLAVAADGSYVYAAGGRNLSANENSTAFERYDPAADRWASLPQMPVPAGGFAAAVVGDQLVAVGGEEPLEVIEAVQAFDLETNTWSALPPMLESRHGHAVLALGDTLFALAGGLEPGHTGSSASAEALEFR